jgi:DNA-binding winged helix-turn-helix (wHTH) protein/Tol biopolymer transport system component
MSLVISGLYRFDEFEVNPARRTFARNGIPVSISPKAFEVLTYLVANPGRVITKDELLKAVWPESFVEESNLSQHIFALRKALGERASCIVTLPGRGYQFTSHVQGATQPQAALVAQHHEHTGNYIVQHIRERTQVVMEEMSPAASKTSTIRRLWWPVRVVTIPAVLVLIVFAAVRLNRPSTVRISAYEQITHDGRAKAIGGTDGSRVYFTEEALGSIAEVSASGGAIEPISVSVKEPWAGDVSPDGSTLLVISQSGGMGPGSSLWSFHLVGGSLRRLADGVIASAWYPDGSRLAYGNATGDIFVIRSDGTEEHKVASPGGYIRALAWSPDGTLLRFSKDGVLWEVSSDGANLRQVLPELGKSPSQFSGQWAQDGRYYFVSGGQIWALDERPRLGRTPRANAVQLTFGPTAWDRPIPSRDGKRIFASGRTKRGELVRFDAKTKQFQPFLGGISAEFVAFSQDAKTVAYVTYPDGVLWRANADGTNPLQLTSPPVYPKSVRWSPGGKEILFVDRTPKGTNGIYVIASDGGRPRQVLPNDPENETDPSWSTDGKKIVYSTCPTLGASSKSDLRILDLATGKITLVPESNGLVTPHWSPDGKFISAMTLDSMSMKVLSIESGKWSSLDTGPVAFPEWSHDSKFIYYLKWKGDAALVRMRPGAASPEIIGELRNAQFTGYFTSWMSLDSLDAPLLLRDGGSDEIYALTLETK